MEKGLEDKIKRIEHLNKVQSDLVSLISICELDKITICKIPAVWSICGMFEFSSKEEIRNLIPYDIIKKNATIKLEEVQKELKEIIK